jgi:hypothetical protein
VPSPRSLSVMNPRPQIFAGHISPCLRRPAREPEKNATSRVTTPRTSRVANALALKLGVWVFHQASSAQQRARSHPHLCTCIMCRCGSIRECGEDVNEPSNMRKVEGPAAFETLVIPGLFGLDHQSHQSSLGMVGLPNLNGSNSIYQRDLGAYIM